MLPIVYEMVWMGVLMVILTVCVVQDGSTALHLAAAGGHRDCVEFLVDLKPQLLNVQRQVRQARPMQLVFDTHATRMEQQHYLWQ